MFLTEEAIEEPKAADVSLVSSVFMAAVVVDVV
jgi:hypothetical protein